MACNLQSAVDGEHYLILHHTITREDGDNQQLEFVAKVAQAGVFSHSLNRRAFFCPFFNG